MTIVALTGLKGCGKDTVADYLVKYHGYQRLAFADALYREVADAFGVPEAHLRSREWKTCPQPDLALRNCKDLEFLRLIVSSEMPQVDYNISPLCSEAQTCPRTSTFIAQRWATEYRRFYTDLFYWTRPVVHSIAKILNDRKSSRIVITDLREPHEYQVLHDFAKTFGPMRFGVVKLIMDGTASTGHSSDQGLPQECITRTIYSTRGDLPGTFKQIVSFIKEDLRWTTRP